MTKINIRDYLHVKEKKDDEGQEIRLTQDQRDEILEAFTLYDKNGDGLIDTKDLGTVMRALGQVPTVCEETDIVAQYAHDDCYDVNYIAFVKLMTARHKKFDEEDELRESFRKFDGEGKGFVNKDKLRHMLTTIGEPLTKAEVDEWLEDGKNFIQSQHIYYEDFATFMLSK